MKTEAMRGGIGDKSSSKSKIHGITVFHPVSFAFLIYKCYTFIKMKILECSFPYTHYRFIVK